MQAISTTRLQRLKVIVISLVSVAVALLLIIWALNMHETSFWRGMLSNIGQTILVGGVLSLAYEYFLRDDIFQIQADSEKRIIDAHDELIEKFDLAENSVEVGLTKIHPKEYAVDYSDMLLSSRNLVLVFNDGRTWLSSHQADLSERLKKPNFKTTVVLAHPSSIFLDCLVGKVGQSRQHLEAKTQESVDMLKNMRGTDHDLVVYGHHMPSSYSILMDDNKCVFVMYPMCRKEDRIPSFEFATYSADSFYFALKRDIDTLIAECSEQMYPPSSSAIPSRLARNPHFENISWSAKQMVINRGQD